MKLKNIFLYAAIAATAMGMSSCEDILDQEPLDSFTDEAVWGDLHLAELYLNDQYARLMPENSEMAWFVSYTDEVYQKHK